jgi:ligand-binding sensor domain-containing protein
MLHKLITILSCIIISCTGAFAQLVNEHDFIQYTRLNGLSDNDITGLTQDANGYIWISTSNGLTRFDGQEMLTKYREHDKHGLINDKLIGIKSTGNKLLVYAQNGAQLIESSQNKHTELQVSKGLSYSDDQNNVFDAVILSGNAYALSTGTGFYVFNNQGKITYRHDFLKPNNKDDIGARPNYGRFMVALDSLRILQFDKEFHIHIYDHRVKRFLSDAEFVKSYPHLFNIQKHQLNLKGVLSKNKLIFYDCMVAQIIIYDIGKDEVYRQSTPAWVHQIIGWSTRWFNLSDSTAVVYHYNLGLYPVYINKTTGRLTFDSKTLFKDYECHAVMLDKDKRLWVATSKGLFKQNTRKNLIHTVDLFSHIKQNNGYSFETKSLCSYNGNLYIGDYARHPVLELDAVTYQLKKTFSFEKISSRSCQIWNIIHFSKDTLWFATQKGIMWYNCTNGNFNKLAIPALKMLDTATVTLSYKDSHGLLWLQGNWGSGVFLYNPADHSVKRYRVDDKRYYLPIPQANFITEDKQSNVWLAGQGLTRWDRRKQQFDTLITTYSGFNKNSTKITSLSSNREGQLVFCNEYNGVLLYEPLKGTYQQLSTDSVLVENAAISVKALPNGYLWIVTRNGVTAWNKPTGDAIHYSYKDGLPMDYYNKAIYHDDINKRMLFGYDNYLVWTPDSIRKGGHQLNEFYIDRISLPGDTAFYFPNKEVNLTYKQNNLTLHFSAINFNDPGNNRYTYRINKNKWISLGKENSILFNDLAPGRYEVEIKYVSGALSAKAIIKKILLVIRPPFWQTWWFILVAGLSVLLIIYLFYRNRLQEVRRLSYLDSQLAQTEMKALQAQMNPHFIFNCLNSIKEMILHQENQEASRYLSQFANLIRLSLEQSSNTFISLYESLNYLQQYINMEKIRNANFTCIFEKDNTLNEHQILLIPTFIQPMIENAIWHSVSGKKRKLVIIVSFLKQGDKLACVINDNGMGILQSEKNKQQSAAKHQSMGIKNIKDRIRLLNEKYNFGVSMSILDKSTIAGETGSGTLVTILFPLQIVSHE